MPYKGGVQLLPESERRPTLSSFTTGNSYFYTAMVIGVIALVATAVLATYKKSLRDKIDLVRTQITTQDQERNTQQEQDLISVSKQSKMLKQLLENKVYWSQAFSKLEKITQSSVTFSNISADSVKGTIQFKASADSYATVARQLASFAAAAGVKDYTIGKLQTNTAGMIEFSGALTIDSRAMLTKPVPSKAPPKP